MAHPHHAPAVAGLAPPRRFPWRRAVDRLRRLADWAAGELAAERERWLLWLPVALGAGVALYFVLPSEPPPWLGPALLATLLGVGVGAWRRDLGPLPLALLLGAIAGAAGITAAQLRTAMVEAPVVERRGAQMVEGEVALVEDREEGGGQRVVLTALGLEGVAAEATPARIRIGLRRTADIVPGERIRVRAVLMPPSPPAAPGDFDFARHAFFLQLGAVGYALGEPEPVAAATGFRPARALAALRQHVAGEIAAAVPGRAGAVASALLTGLRAAIPDEVWRHMQIAGIAHLLAISGLHLGLVAGTLFFAARIAIALVPPLALRVPGKKVAAAIALLGALGYLLITGGTVPTQRAFVMTALALLAIMVDRNPFSMRLVAVAAVLVLLTQPESLLGASFQMSFAAVVALIAVYERGVGRRPERGAGLDRKLALYIGGVTLTTVVASIATAPFALVQFNRVATFGIVANLIAVPLTAFWIMPLGLLGLLLLPLGLAAPCFALMGRGIELVLVVAATVAQWPWAAALVASPPAAALPLTVLGALWLCLWRRPWRLLGLLGPALALALMLAHQPPDLLMDRSGRLAAVRLDDGRLAIAPWERDRWVTNGWLRRNGQEEAAPWPAEGSGDGGGLACDGLGCVLTRHGRTVALARRAEALEEDCARADLVLSYPYLERCPGATPLIGPRALRDAHGLALRLAPAGVHLRTTREHRGTRPWVR